MEVTARVRDSARIIAATQIGHVTLWHSPNDCNTLQHCSQPLHAYTHSIACAVLFAYASRSAEQCAQVNDELSGNAFHASYSGRCAFASMSRKFFARDAIYARTLQSRKCECQLHQCDVMSLSVFVRIIEYLNRIVIYYIIRLLQFALTLSTSLHYKMTWIIHSLFLNNFYSLLTWKLLN